jgi:hypothetical protein
LVGALRYIAEVRGFDFRWCCWNSFCGRTMVLGSTQPLNRNERKCCRRVMLSKPYDLLMQIVSKSESRNCLDISGPVQALVYLQGAGKRHTQTWRCDRRDQNKDLLSGNCMTDMRPCSATDRRKGSE